jgi:hypothetical protein
MLEDKPKIAWRVVQVSSLPPKPKSGANPIKEYPLVPHVPRSQLYFAKKLYTICGWKGMALASQDLETFSL